MIPIGLIAISGLKKIREIDLHEIAGKFDGLITEIKETRQRIESLEHRLARVEGIIMRATQSITKAHDDG